MNTSRSFKFILLFILCFITFLSNRASCTDKVLQDKMNQISDLSDKDKATVELIINGTMADFSKVIDDGALDVNSKIAGKTLTAITINNNKLDKFKALIEKGADPNAVDPRGRSLLILAAQNVRPFFVSLLLKQKGIKTSLVDSNNMTATDYVVDFTTEQAQELKEIDDRKESVYVLKRQAKNIYDDIVEYRANSFIKIDESKIFKYIPSSVEPIIKSNFLGRPVWRWLLAFFFLLLTIIVNKVMQKYLSKLVVRYTDDDDTYYSRRDFVASVIGAINSSLRFLIRWIGIYFVLAILAPVILEAASWTLDVIITYGAAVFFYNLSDVMETIVLKWMDKSELRLSNALSTLIKKSIKVIIVIVATLHIYSTITGNSITTLVAGLGIGGMAVALAATDTLKNFLGFVTIVTDKPFVVGERVEVKGYDGVVEYIGVRTTRIRRLDGHQVSIPNSITVSDAVRNIQRRPYLKKEISVTITYDTPIVKVEKAIQILKDIMENHEGMHNDYPPRVYFANMNSDNLEITVTFWYFPADWYPFCELTEKINLQIMKSFEAEGIEFAFPTQTLYLAGDPSRKLLISNESGTDNSK